MILLSKLLSSVPGVRHGFSTRLGGVSSGSFASLNLGRDVGDEEENIARNRSRFAHAIGLPGAESLVAVNQVHGDVVLEASSIDAASPPAADGIWTRESGRGVGVRTADCAPVLIAALGTSGRAEVVAAVHAGWRGAVAGIVARAVEKLGAPRSSLRIAIGPTIGLDAFEVGEEVVEAARASLGGAEPPFEQRGPKLHLDLRALLVQQLSRLDVDPAHVERVGGCTAEHPALYFSHRRDKGRTGRHLSAIYLT